MAQTQKQHLILIGITLFVSALILLPWYPAQLICGLLLIGVLPGCALLTAIRPHSTVLNLRDSWLYLAIPLSYGLSITLLLMMAFLRLPFNKLSVLFALGGLTLLGLLVSWYRSAKTAPHPNPLPKARESTAHPEGEGERLYNVGGLGKRVLTPPDLTWLTIILLLAGFIRMVNVGFSDHQGDEADILFRAVSLVYGQVETLLTHSKGPGEILLLNAIGALTGRFDELTARLPFSLAGTFSIGLIFLMGRRFFGRSIGVIAGLLAAIDGVFVSYARTAQYQSVVLLLTLAAIWLLFEFYEDKQRTRLTHALGTFLLAASFLVHFETVLLLPVAGWLTIGYFSDRLPATDYGHLVKDVLGALLRLWPSIILFITMLGIFYIPFFLNPAIGKTGEYLEGRIGGGDQPPFNNLDHFFYFEGLKYNAVYYVALFDLILIGVLIALLLRSHPLNISWLRRPLPQVASALVTVIAFALLFTGAFKLSALTFALAFALFFGLIILSADLSPSHRTLLLWIAPPFWIYVFLVNRPGKHHYLFLAALTLLLAWGVVYGWRWLMERWSFLKQPMGQWVAGGIGLILLSIFFTHTAMVLLRSDLEYVLTYPAQKSALFPTDSDYPYGTRIGFGYPFRLGWQKVGELRRTGQISDSWAGNDGGNSPEWYMLGSEPTFCYPEYVLRGDITYKGDEDFDVSFDIDNFGYRPIYRISVNDQQRMTIFAFDPLGQRGDPIEMTGTPTANAPVTVADFVSFFTSTSPEPAFRPDAPLVLGEGSELKLNAPEAYLERAQQLEGRIALIGYDLASEYAVPNSILPITLYWQTNTTVSLRYKVFVHLISSEGQLWAQADDFPVCGTSHTNSWEPNELVLDRHLLHLPPDMPPGEYTMIVGMYEPDLNLRLNYFDIANNEQGNSLNVGVVSVK